MSTQQFTAASDVTTLKGSFKIHYLHSYEAALLTSVFSGQQVDSFIKLVINTLNQPRHCSLLKFTFYDKITDDRFGINLK